MQPSSVHQEIQYLIWFKGNLIVLWRWSRTKHEIIDKLQIWWTDAKDVESEKF